MIKIRWFMLGVLFTLPLAALAQTGNPAVDSILPMVGDKQAVRIAAAWPLVFFAAQSIKKLWKGRHTIVGKVVFPILDFITGDTVPKE